MAFDGILCTEAQIVEKEGVREGTAITEAQHNINVGIAQGILCSATRYDWVTNVGTIKAAFLGMINDVVASLAAIEGIQYDFDAYPSVGIAENKINILRDSALRDISFLEDPQVQTAVGVVIV